MGKWSYRCYVDARQPNFWRRWYDENSAMHAKHDEVFDTIEQQEQWTLPYVKPVGKGISEVRINSSVAWRIFGFFGGGPKTFIVCNIDRHVGRKGDLAGGINLARKRMADIKSGKELAVKCERPGKT